MWNASGDRIEAGSPLAKGMEGEKRQVRRVLPCAAFEEKSFKGWSTPKSFNEAAAGNKRSEVENATKTQEPAAESDQIDSSLKPSESLIISQRPMAKEPPSAGSLVAQKTTFDRLHQQHTRARALAIIPTRPKEPAHLNKRSKQFERTGSTIIAHLPAKSCEEPARSLAPLNNHDDQSDDLTGAWAWERRKSSADGSTRGRSASSSEGSQRRLLNSAASSVPEGGKVKMCAAGFGTKESGNSPFAAETPPLVGSHDKQAHFDETEEERTSIIPQTGAIRPATHQSKRSEASVRHVQLQDDAFVEEIDKDGEAEENESAKEEDEVLERILDSPEMANRRANIKASLHSLSLHDVHEGIEEVDDHVYEKRAKLIKKRFKLLPWMVRERNMLWFAPPVEELQGQSLGCFGEWDPARLICVDLLRSPVVQTAFFSIQLVAIIVLAFRPAREAVNYEYNAYGEPVPAPYYSFVNVYFVAEIIAFLTLAVEVFLAVVARGLLEGHYAFVKDPFNLLDFAILGISFSEFILWALGWTPIFRGFRVLRLLKPIMLINISEGSRAVVSGVRNSAEFVFVILLIIMVIILAFSAGLPPLFGAQMHRRCVVGRTDTQYVLDRFNNTQRVRIARGRGFGFCQIYNRSTSLLGWATYDDSCPKQANGDVAKFTAGAGVDQVCDPLIGIPDGGFGQVDTIWSSFMGLLQASAGDSWHISPWKFSEANPKWTTLSWSIFSIPSVCCTLFLFQAIVALGARKYDETRLEHKSGKSSFLNVLGNAERHEHHEDLEDLENATSCASSKESELHPRYKPTDGQKYHHHSSLRSHSRSPAMGNVISGDNFLCAPQSHVRTDFEDANIPTELVESPPRMSPSTSSPNQQSVGESPLEPVGKRPLMSSKRKTLVKSPIEITDTSAPEMKASRADLLSTSPRLRNESRSSFLSERSIGERLARLITNLLFDALCMTAILVNNAMLMLELEERSAHYGNEGQSRFSDARLIFSLFFMVEFLVRIGISGSMYKHFRNPALVVDFAIVFIDAAGMFAVAMGSGRWHVLRSVVGFRLYRIALVLPGSSQLLQTACNKFSFLISALAAPVVFLVACAITTHHFFGEGLRFGSMQQFSYFSFSDAFRMMMHVSWGDKWHEIFFGSLQSAANVAIASRIKPDPQATAYLGTLLVVVIFYIMRFWIHGVFIGVVAECFHLGDIEHQVQSQVYAWVEPMRKWGAFQARLSTVIEKGDMALWELILSVSTAFTRAVKLANSKVMRRLFPYWDLATPVEVRDSVVHGGAARGPFTSVASTPDSVSQQGDSPDYEIFGDAIDTVLSAPRRPPVLGHPAHTSLWIPVFGGLPYKNPIRIICRLFLGSFVWKILVNLSAFLSCAVILIGETNRTALPDVRVAENFVKSAHSVFTFVFIAELVMHVLAQGLVFPPRAYLREVESIFDVIMLLINLLDAQMEESSRFLRAILILRLLRLFRPPRPFRSGEGMIYHTVMGALLWMSILTVFASFLYVLFAIIGMEIFSGQLHSCSCSSIKYPSGQKECRGNGISGSSKDGFYGDILQPVLLSGDGFLAPCSWSAPMSGDFDTFANSLLALARISGRKWSDLMQACMNIAGRGHQPVPSARADTVLYFAVFIAVSVILVENLCSAFMIQGFGRGLHFADVSREQLQIETIEKVIVQVRPAMAREWPKNSLSIRCRKLMKNIWFQRTFLVSLLVHAVILLSQHGGMDINFISFITTQNNVFFGLLCAETLIAFTAFGIKNFFAVPFHWLDLLLIGLGTYSYTAGLSNELAFVRILRVLRLFTIIAPKSRSLGYVNEMFHYSIGMVLQSLALFVIALIIFSLIGFSMFAHIRPGERLGRTANFDTFGMSTVTLLQIVLGDEWQQLMVDCAVLPPRCDQHVPGSDTGDCGTPFAPSFFLAYKFVVNGLCLNIVIASFIHGLHFSKTKRTALGPYPKIRIESELQKFAEHWKKFDPGATRKMKVSMVASFLLQLPKPLGFGKVSKLQKLTEFQRLKSLSITTELAIIAGLCEGINAGTPVLKKMKLALMFTLKILTKIICCCLMRRKKQKKSSEPEESQEVDYEAINDRFWLLNASKLGKSYYPAGRVDHFWLNLAQADSVTFEQVCTTVLAQMIPDYVSAERVKARAPITRVVTGVVKSVQIANFCRRCLASDDMRQQATARRFARWRTWSLSILNTKLGMISSITAMGYGTWVEVKPHVVEPPKLEAEKEREIVDELISHCEMDLRQNDCDVKALTMTLLSLKKRRAAAQAEIEAVQKLKEEREREEEARQQAMMQRVQQLCDKGHCAIEEAECQYEILSSVGPITSDTLIRKCVGRIDEIVILLDQAEGFFDKAIKAGSFYGLRGTADDGMAEGDDLRIRLDSQEERLYQEDEEFRRPLKVFANFVRLENADDFAMIHHHDHQRKLNEYFASILLQAYVRRKQERIRFCAVSARSLHLGRFVPISSQASLSLAPLNDSHQYITAHRAGFASNRIALLRMKQLQDHLGFSIMSPTSPISSSSPLRDLAHQEESMDPDYIAEQIRSPRGMLYKRNYESFKHGMRNRTLDYNEEDVSDAARTETERWLPEEGQEPGLGDTEFLHADSREFSSRPGSNGKQAINFGW